MMIIIIIINIYITQIPCEYDQMRVTNQYDTNQIYQFCSRGARKLSYKAHKGTIQLRISSLCSLLRMLAGRQLAKGNEDAGYQGGPNVTEVIVLLISKEKSTIKQC